jgi:hypothetical protein
MDITNTIVPKSDQLNADDLIAGPMTITITDVTKGSPEQPVSIQYEGGQGRPYKPGKSMRRVLVAMWGAEAKNYVGRSLTLYRDPEIRFGSDAVGGIRISHATDIPAPFEIALTVTRGRRKPFVVQPLAITKRTTNAAQAQAQDPDGSLDEAIYAAQQVGPQKAKDGIEALKSYWSSLPKAVQAALAKEKDEWKQIAGGVA